MKKMSLAYSALIGLLFVSSLTGCGTKTPSVSTLDEVYGSQAQNLYGKLRVALGSGYGTQATVADIASLKVTLSGSKIATPIVKSVAKDAASVEFPGLPIGNVAIKIQAFDAANAEIGVVNQDAIAIQGGQTTKVALKMKLVPTVTSGDLSVSLAIEDGDVIGGGTTPSNPTTAAFSDNFEAGMNNWEASFSNGTSTSNWNAAGDATNHYATPGDANGKVTEQGTYSLTMKDTINLSASANPTLSFNINSFVPTYYFRNAKFAVDVLQGTQWTQVYEATAAISTSTPVSVSLKGYASSATKVRFRFNYDSIILTGTHTAVKIDDVKLQ